MQIRVIQDDFSWKLADKQNGVSGEGVLFYAWARLRILFAHNFKDPFVVSLSYFLSSFQWASQQLT